jgi:glycosyltransferase involved in cell wall biosynthesis
VLSVFTAAHESGARIERAARSLLAQTHPAWEWVVVDDAPGHATAARLERLAATTPALAGRLRIVRRDGDGSIGASKAAAASACRGEALVELDHDDELTPDALELLAAAFAADPAIDFLCSDWIDHRDGDDAPLHPPGWAFGFGLHATEVVGGRRRAVALTPPLTWETVRHIVSVPNHVRAWRRTFYARIGGHDPSFPVADDYELLVRTILHGTCARIPRPLYLQHHEPGGRSASRVRNAEIQRRVAEVAADAERALDERCLAAGAIPHAPGAGPLTSAEPPHRLDRVVDPLADAAAARGEPLVTVVIPTRHRPGPLARALESVLAQTHGALDVVVVGDGCEQAAAVVAACGDDRVRHATLDRHHGDSGAAPRNAALHQLARGTLIAYLDDDNRWDPDHVETLVAALAARPDASFAFSSYRAGWATIDCALPRLHLIDTSALLHRRALIAAHGGWRPAAETGWAHDWELAERWLGAGERWVATGRATVDYTLRDPALLPAFEAAARAAAEDRTIEARRGR